MEQAHILYVEDDEVLSFVTKDNLELKGYKVTHAKDGKEAIKIFKNGEKFEGRFEKGEENGTGTLKDKEGKVLRQGMWINGEFVEG